MEFHVYLDLIFHLLQSDLWVSPRRLATEMVPLAAEPNDDGPKPRPTLGAS